MYYSFFIHSSVDGHLGGFHVLAIVKSAEMNCGVCVSYSVFVSPVYMSRSGIAESYGDFIPRFQGISIPYSIVAVSIYIPNSNA